MKSTCHTTVRSICERDKFQTALEEKWTGLSLEKTSGKVAILSVAKAPCIKKTKQNKTKKLPCSAVSNGENENAM